MNKLFQFRISYKISLFFYYFTFVIFLVILGMLIYPYKTVDYNSIKILNPKIKAGETLELKVDYCRYTEKPTISSRKIIDTVVYILPSANISNAMGCGETISLIPLPINIPVGDYQLEIDASWQVNFFRIIHKKMPVLDFEVVK